MGCFTTELSTMSRVTHNRILMLYMIVPQANCYSHGPIFPLLSGIGVISISAVKKTSHCLFPSLIEIQLLAVHMMA